MRESSMPESKIDYDLHKTIIYYINSQLSSDISLK